MSSGNPGTSTTEGLFTPSQLFPGLMTEVDDPCRVFPFLMNLRIHLDPGDHHLVNHVFSSPPYPRLIDLRKQPTIPYFPDDLNLDLTGNGLAFQPTLG